MSKVGFAGDDAPRAVFPTVVGRPKRMRMGMGVMGKDTYVGDECYAKRGILKVKTPIVHGQVHNWYDVEKIYHHSFYNELRVTPEEHPVFTSEYPLCIKENRSKLTVMMFETFNVPAFYTTSSAITSLYASGRTTGCVVSSGANVTSIVPIYESSQVEGAIETIKIGGNTITDYILKYMNNDCERNYEFYTSSEREIIENVKEKYCYIEMNVKNVLKTIQKQNKIKKFGKEYSYQVLSYINYYKQYKQLFNIFPIEIINEIFQYGNTNYQQKSYLLPDDTKIYIRQEQFLAPEILFKPSIIQCNDKGIVKALYKSIQKLDICERRCYYNNIILGGGNTLFTSLKERIERDLYNILPKHSKVTVNAPNERKFSCWIGSSILSSLSTFQNMWISKDEYDEIGSEVVNRKCLN